MGPSQLAENIYFRSYHERRREHRLEVMRAYYQKRKNEIRAQRLKKHAEAPERKRARELVKTALKSGKLEKKPCRCGNPCAEAHHDDYRRPLDVRWFCRKHHAAWHRVFLVEE